MRHSYSCCPILLADTVGAIRIALSSVVHGQVVALFEALGPAGGLCTRILHMTEYEVDPVPTSVLVRYWAAARSAAGVETDRVQASTLAEVYQEIERRHDSKRFKDVIAICAVLIGETPVGDRQPAEVGLSPGDAIEFLPPFAGG